MLDHLDVENCLRSIVHSTLAEESSTQRGRPLRESLVHCFEYWHCDRNAQLIITEHTILLNLVKSNLWRQSLPGILLFCDSHNDLHGVAQHQCMAMLRLYVISQTKSKTTELYGDENRRPCKGKLPDTVKPETVNLKGEASVETPGCQSQCSYKDGFWSLPLLVSVIQASICFNDSGLLWTEFGWASIIVPKSSSNGYKPLIFVNCGTGQTKWCTLFMSDVSVANNWLFFLCGDDACNWVRTNCIH